MAGRAPWRRQPGDILSFTTGASVPVQILSFLRPLDVYVVDGMVVAGSQLGLAYALFEINKRLRPRRRPVRNPTGGARRTDFGARWLRAGR